MTHISENSNTKTDMSLLKFWEQEVLPRLNADLVYDHPSHAFQRSSQKWRGGSPFRKSKSGTSFAVWPDTLRFYDAGCEFAGDPIAYIHSIKVGRWEHPKGIDWVEALREIASRVGVALPPRELNTREIEVAAKWEARRGILAAVYAQCRDWLWGEEGTSALNHLIAERGIPREAIAELGLGYYYSKDEVASQLKEHKHNLEIAEEVGVLTSKWEGYVTFPWHTALGQPLTVYGHCPTKPLPLKKNHRGWKGERDAAYRTWGKLSEAQKLEQPWTEPTIPKKYACWNPHDEEGAWLATKESPLYFDKAIAAGHKEVVVVEGVTDAAVAQALGDTRVIACVAASLSFEQVQSLRRSGIERVIICLDPDSAGDKGIESCIKSLLLAGIIPYVAPRLPVGEDGDGDPDKFIIRNGIDAWLEHTNLEKAEHGLRWKAQQIAGSKGNTDADKQAVLKEATKWATHIKDAMVLNIFFWPTIGEVLGNSPPPWLKEFGKELSEVANRDDSASKEVTKCPDRKRDAFYRNLCDKLGLDFNYYTRGRTFDDFVVRKVFGQDYKAINSAMYQYTGSGWWMRQDEKRCEHAIATCSEKVFKLRQVSKWKWEETFPFSSESCTNSALKYAMKRLYLEPPQHRHFRAFKNGTVDMRTGELLPHDPTHYLTSAIESDYVRDRPCPQVFLDFIISAFGEDQLDAVRAYTSMLIDPTAPDGKFIHVIGPSGSGKGTLVRLWGEIFGLEDSHSGDFAELSNPESRHQHLTGKSLYTIPDTGGYITGIRPFYELVDNGKLSGRSLYSSCGYTKEWNCRFVAASVDHLQIENAGDGWDRRCLPLLSKGREGLEDPYLRHKLSAVKADIVSWALAMPRQERDALLLQPSKNNRIRLAKLDAATYGDPVRSFIDLCFRPSDSTSQIQNHELHSWFIAYCKAHGYSDNRGMSKFISHLKTVIPQHHVPRLRKDGELQPAHWTHMALIPGVMVDVSLTEDVSNGYQGKPNPQHPEPEWRCAKFRCCEGGLLAFEEWNERNMMGGITPDFDQESNGNANTQGNEEVRVFLNQQHGSHQKTGEELNSAPNTHVYPTQTHTQPEIEGAGGTSRSSPSSCVRSNRVQAIDEWVSQLSEVANRGTTYEAVKGLGVPDNLRPEIFAALTPPVKERLKELRKEFEGRIPQDVQKWREAIATWSALDAETLNTQWQQFDLWSQCLLGIGNWVERITRSGLFELAASVYSQAIELATEKSEPFVDADETNAEPKQLNLLPEFQPPLESENRFLSESEDWF
ncbi:MAG: toprim domain-containing protein [Microcoleus sp. PH2017_25_DOB_D_A]|uniref:toprim domain-containing protein n=1 Tax=unclassified Microcoleus TaxID=2642155 RepID=UPI001E1A890D|nr:MULTISPECIES: toprim domain-containing protein [unclassified Microcoleus]MCC3537582.1 toprim domain-containing protein [Microcoleus sp. PH2017_25_DOB_D_A]MCC3549825.1 toprim domain-containing protein [Microcoleus sp. PH2017_24_DOB_U_A]